jgi:hypothetical protein
MKRPTRSLRILCKFLLVSALVSAPVGCSSSSTVKGTTKVHLDSEMGRQSESSVLPERESPLKTSEVVVRFYFIRHGETLVNINGLVLGQTDSVRKQCVGLTRQLDWLRAKNFHFFHAFLSLLASQ